MLHKQAGSPERFHELVVEVFRLRVPDLFIIDAVVGMEGNGPASTELRTIGRIIASDNAVALDSVMARMAGLDPGVLRFLRHARAAGLGDFDPQAVKILGELTVIPDFKLPPLSGEAISGSAVIQEFLASRTRMRPRSNPETCTVCGLCVDQCPAQALTLTETGPVVNDESCIACFCCQEMCPTRAIVLS
jgi:ferredoxin